MADDYLTQIAIGALEGFERTYLPFKKAEYEDLLAKKRKKEEIELETEQKLKVAKETPYRVYNPETQTYDVIVGGKPVSTEKQFRPQDQTQQQELLNKETEGQKLLRLESESKARSRGQTSGRVESRGEPISEAGKISLSEQAVDFLEKTKNTLFPDGTYKSFRRDVATQITLKAALSEEAQDVKRWLTEALSAKVLIQTGVAANETEIKQKVESYMVGATTNPKSFIKIFSELTDFYKKYQKKVGVVQSKKDSGLGLPQIEPTEQKETILKQGNGWRLIKRGEK